MVDDRFAALRAALCDTFRPFGGPRWLMNPAIVERADATLDGNVREADMIMHIEGTEYVLVKEIMANRDNATCRLHRTMYTVGTGARPGDYIRLLLRIREMRQTGSSVATFVQEYRIENAETGELAASGERHFVLSIP